MEMMGTVRVLLITMVYAMAAVAAMTLTIGSGRSTVAAFAEPFETSSSPLSLASSPITGAQSGCPSIFPEGPVAVPPNQPEVKFQSTEGIINALCDVTIDVIGCSFTPTSITIACDTNGDGVSDISIPLKNITIIN